ncbi:MAG: AcrB/AcrD/AcrF family protein [Deltaproteobacteria bacterium CG_4_10_14_0_2_um_filter_43_8]|nr:MAG: MFS transporter [Deltaproteobacteria bacterium CG11_big_fil_rev_8_21_14_0_20_42_23]PJA19945.1 MAG: AcrB/AcrD/AcrF family protein [Deltaproteobacteria bacterium CG_4_10_14_0_2_um_filter_43_8]PJC63598.1 MAG: AcrB/AcrD/AcrF family protein [Deltaproteobacteria bacterium CG_4_9_14_0_2_um_filter_42_21]
MKRLLSFFLSRPLLVNLGTIIVLIAGFMSLSRLNRDVFPNISLDKVYVSAVYPGSAPEEVEKLITIPIEKELKEVDDILQMTSVSVEGRTAIVLEIDPDTNDISRVVNDIQRAVDKVPDFPQDLKDKPLVTELKTKDTPIIEVSLSGEMSELDLQVHAKALEDRFLDLPLVSKVVRKGWRDREYWVEVDPQKAADYYISLGEIISSLADHNVNVAGGSVIDNHVEALVRTNGEFAGVMDINNMILRSSIGGGTLKVEDLAKVTDTFEREETISRTDGTRAINLVVIKREKADAIDLVKEIRSTVADYESTLQDSQLSISLINDFSYYVKRRLNVMVSNGWVGMLLVIVCLFAFLSSRIAFVTTIGIPIAFLTTFIFMYFNGITINLITMFGLIMVLGMLVDDAIIIAENVHRHMEEGKSAKDAALVGTLEVWKPVLSSILTTCAAFTPLMFMGGIMGKFSRYIPLVVILALAASLFEAFIVLPSHLAEMERIPKKTHPRLTHIRNWLEQKIQTITETYLKLLHWVLRKRYLFLGIISLVMVITLYQAYQLRYIAFPQRGVEAFFVRAETAPGTSLERTAELMTPVEKMIARLPKSEVDNFVLLVGVHQEDPNDPEAKRASNLAQITVFLKPIADRNLDADQLIQLLEQDKKEVAGLEKLLFEKVRVGPPVGKPVEIRIEGEEMETLQVISAEVQEFLKGLKGLSALTDSYDEGKEEITFRLDEQKLAQAGISLRDFGQAVKASLDGIVATTIKKSEEEIDVRVRFPYERRYDLNVLEEVTIPNAEGKLIPLTSVSRFEKKPGVLSLGHFDRKRVIVVSANVDEENATSLSVISEVKKAFRDLDQRHKGYHIAFGGEYEKNLQSFKDFGFALIIACMVIFFILCVQFKSMLQPLVIMFAIPFGVVGATWAFVVHGEPKSFFAMLGVIGLSGVVVNDSIVFVDFINRMREEGKDILTAAYEAGRYRLRAVILTTVTTVLGLLPVAYGFMGNDPFLKPMALAFGWGLLVATVSTLLVTPTLYVVIEEIKSKLHKRFF